MNTRDPKLIALLFNECKNKRDYEGMRSLMSESMSLVTYGNIDTADKDSSSKAWLSFWEDYPDYLNHISWVESRNDFVILIGKSICSNNDFLNKNAIWSAKIEDDKVSEWQVYDDTVENRKRLKIL
jgi:hypothetical protein